VVSAYRPVKNKNGEYSTYKQQDHYFEEEEGISGCCPREAFTNDFALDLQHFCEAGE
jgi:hypothetical protein